MAEPLRVLQVTYGAFSCTLEGFEDPVEALIAVAEYFRGLAAEDPGFVGAARVPDADELRRLVAEAGAGEAVEVRIEAAETAPPDAGPAAGDEAPVAQAGAPEPAGPDGDGPEDAAGAGAAAPAPPEPPAGADEGTQDGAGPEGGMREETVVAEGQDLGEGAPPRREALLDLSWMDDEDGAEPAPARSQLRDPAEAGEGPDLAQLALALALRKSPPSETPAEPEPEAAPPAEPDAAPEAEGEAEAPPPVPDPEPAPSADPIAAGTYDWGVTAEDDWFVEGAEIEPGPVVPAPEPSAPGRRWILNHSPDQDEAVLRRILSRAESKLSDPEMTRRREAMAHLKAAVAATEAERSMIDAGGSEDAEPLPEVAARAEAAGGAPPLRLVASQRVDLPRMRAALRGTRVRPRAVQGGPDRPADDDATPRPRVVEPAPAPLPADGAEAAAPEPAPEPATASAADVAASASTPEPEPALRSDLAALASGPEPEPRAEAPDATDRPAPPPEEPARDLPAPPPSAATDGFAEFARARGASGLPDILEAAAAWAARPGQPREATRVELSALAAEVLGAPPAREELLRVVGILLREGRLAKLEGGRFRAPAGGRFDPQA